MHGYQDGRQAREVLKTGNIYHISDLPAPRAELHVTQEPGMDQYYSIKTAIM